MIAAIVTGRLDPFDGLHEEERGDHTWERNLDGADFRQRQRRDRYHAKRDAKRLRDRLGDLCPF